jgi:hypothetical protein
MQNVYIIIYPIAFLYFLLPTNSIKNYINNYFKYP